jgi:PAS domain-containing protein
LPGGHRFQPSLCRVMKDEFMKINIPSDTMSREQFLEAIVESAIDYAIIAMDLDGLVTSWNEGAHNILGWTADEMIGKPATAFFTQESSPGE